MQHPITAITRGMMWGMHRMRDRGHSAARVALGWRVADAFRSQARQQGDGARRAADRPRYVAE